MPIGQQIGPTKGYKRGGFGGIQATKRHNQQLLSDVQRMNTGTLGLSENEKQRTADATGTAAAQQASALSTDLTRSAMQGGMSPVVGQTAQLQRDIARDSEEQAAQGRMGADSLSHQLAEAQRQEILARLERQNERQAKRTKSGVKAVGKAVTTIIGAIAGFMGGGPMGAVQGGMAGNKAIQ